MNMKTLALHFKKTVRDSQILSIKMKVRLIILTVPSIELILNTVNININGLSWKNSFENYSNVYEKNKKRINMQKHIY